jgi:secreted trypsin-like serine protease
MAGLGRGIDVRSMRTRLSVVIGSVILGMLVTAAPTSAMTDLATFDGNTHPEVVALLYRTPDGTRAYQYCTGTLISPTVVLTASHCNDGLLETGWELVVTNDPALPPVDATGWFDADLQNVARVEQVVSNPRYERGYRDDVSAQVIAKPLGVAKRHFPALPALGVLDRMSAAGALKSTPTTVLGYGTIQQSVVPGSGPAFYDSSERRSAVLFTTSLDPVWIHQEMSIAKGQGGACYGDSGGPSLMDLGGRSTVVGVTSTGDGACFATNVSSRVDTASALDFLADVLSSS